MLPGRRTFRTGVKWFFWPALIILALNIENLATAFGWHDALVRSWPAVAGAVTWLELPAAALVGAGLALWIDKNLRREEAFKALDDLYAEGVAGRNRLIPPIADYDDEAERAALTEWSERVLLRLRDAGVGVSSRSNFRTLNKFDPEFHAIVGKKNSQSHVESMWNEKLNRLQVILAKFDA